MNWQDVQGWLSEPEGVKLRELATNRLVLEIGSYKGRSSACMAPVARHLVAVDHWKGDDYAGKYSTDSVMADYFNMLNAHDLNDKVTAVVAPFSRVLPKLKNNDFELVYYDAGHDGFTTQAGIAAAHLLWPNAILAVHDYDLKQPQYVDAVGAIDRMAANYGHMEVTDRLAVMYPEAVQ